MTKLATIVHDAVQEMLSAGRVTPNAIALYIENTYADELEAEAARLVGEAVRRRIKDDLRKRSDDDDGQETFPGLGLPSAIYVRSVDGNDADYYVRSDAATWVELLAGRDVRVGNVEHAMEKLRHYNEALDALRPYMEDTELTVDEAMRRIRSAG